MQEDRRMLSMRFAVLYRKVSSQRFVKRLCIKSLQYFPIFTSLLALLECLTLAFDLEKSPTDSIWSMDIPKFMLLVMKYFCVVIFLLVSKAFGFCRMNRLMILYTCAVLICVDWRKYVGFGDGLEVCRHIMALIGIALFVKLIVNWTEYHNQTSKL